MSEKDRKVNKKIANENKVDLDKFLRNTGKKVFEIDSNGNAIIDNNDIKRKRWLEE